MNNIKNLIDKRIIELGGQTVVLDKFTGKYLKIKKNGWDVRNDIKNATIITSENYDKIKNELNDYMRSKTGMYSVIYLYKHSFLLLDNNNDLFVLNNNNEIIGITSSNDIPNDILYFVDENDMKRYRMMNKELFEDIKEEYSINTLLNNNWFVDFPSIELDELVVVFDLEKVLNKYESIVEIGSDKFNELKKHITRAKKTIYINSIDDKLTEGEM